MTETSEQTTMTTGSTIKEQEITVKEETKTEEMESHVTPMEVEEQQAPPPPQSLPTDTVTMKEEEGSNYHPIVQTAPTASAVATAVELIPALNAAEVSKVASLTVPTTEILPESNDDVVTATIVASSTNDVTMEATADPIVAPTHVPVYNMNNASTFEPASFNTNKDDTGVNREETEQQWHSMFRSFQKYIATPNITNSNNQSMDVDPISNPALAEWVVEQRRQHVARKEGRTFQLTADRRLLLDALEFNWDGPTSIATPGTTITTAGNVINSRGKLLPLSSSRRIGGGGGGREDTEKWNSRIEQLRQFKATHGHPNVPETYKNDIDLGKWVAQQRATFRKATMSDERIVALTALGFDFAPGDKKVPFKVRLEQLKEYRAIYRDVRIPRKWAQNPGLGEWLHSQKKMYRRWQNDKKGGMTEERRKILLSVGVDFSLMDPGPRGTTTTNNLPPPSPKTSKAHMLAASATAAVVASNNIDGKTIWALPQQQLNRVSKWDEKFHQLRAYKALHGHANVPRRSKRNPIYDALGEWVHFQRRQYRNLLGGRISTMTVLRKKALEYIEFEWARTGFGSGTTAVHPAVSTWVKRTWERQYAQLREFRVRYGHTNVPRNWVVDPSLAIWVYQQRELGKAWKIKVEKEEKEIASSVHKGAGIADNETMSSTITEVLHENNNGVDKQMKGGEIPVSGEKDTVMIEKSSAAVENGSKNNIQDEQMDVKEEMKASLGEDSKIGEALTASNNDMNDIDKENKDGISSSEKCNDTTKEGVTAVAVVEEPSGVKEEIKEEKDVVPASGDEVQCKSNNEIEGLKQAKEGDIASTSSNDKLEAPTTSSPIAESNNTVKQSKKEGEGNMFGMTQERWDKLISIGFEVEVKEQRKEKIEGSKMMEEEKSVDVKTYEMMEYLKDEKVLEDEKDVIQIVIGVEEDTSSMRGIDLDEKSAKNIIQQGNEFIGGPVKKTSIDIGMATEHQLNNDTVVKTPDPMKESAENGKNKIAVGTVDGVVKQELNDADQTMINNTDSNDKASAPTDQPVEIQQDDVLPDNTKVLTLISATIAPENKETSKLVDTVTTSEEKTNEENQMAAEEKMESTTTAEIDNVNCSETNKIVKESVENNISSDQVNLNLYSGPVKKKTVTLSVTWEERYLELIQFKLRKGSCNVPPKWKPSPNLYQWVDKQREQYLLFKQGKPSVLHQGRVNKLNLLGFSFNCADEMGLIAHPNPNQDPIAKPSRTKKVPVKKRVIKTIRKSRFKEGKWLESLARVVAYKEAHDNCNVPRKWKPDPTLGEWVHFQRRQYRNRQQGKRNHMTDERIERLESIGFQWNRGSSPNSSFTRVYDQDKADSIVSSHQEIANAPPLALPLDMKSEEIAFNAQENYMGAVVETKSNPIDASVVENKATPLVSPLDMKSEELACNPEESAMDTIQETNDASMLENKAALSIPISQENLASAPVELESSIYMKPKEITDDLNQNVPETVGKQNTASTDISIEEMKKLESPRDAMIIQELAPDSDESVSQI